MRRTCKDGVQCTKRYRWGILQVNSCELESKPTRMGRGDLEIGKGGGGSVGGKLAMRGVEPLN